MRSKTLAWWACAAALPPYRPTKGNVGEVKPPQTLPPRKWCLLYELYGFNEARGLRRSATLQNPLLFRSHEPHNTSESGRRVI
jgi:hypothetical protein